MAYARVITDGATFAWLCDVFVDSSVRGLRIGIALVETVCEALGGLGLKRIVLATGDAHSMYSRFGFEPLDNPDMWMVKSPAS